MHDARPRRTLPADSPARTPARRATTTATLLLAVVSVLLFVVWLQPTVERRPRAPWELVALGVGFALAARLSVRERVAGHTLAFTLVELPLVVGMLTFRPLHVALLCQAGTAVGLLAAGRSRRTLDELVTHAATTFEVALALAVHVALGSPTDVLRTETWLTVLGVVTGARLVRSLLVSLIARMDGAGTTLRSLLGDALLTLGACVSLTSVALVSVMVARTSAFAIALVAVVCALPVVAYRAYLGSRARFARLRMLQEFTGGLTRTLDVDEVVDSALDRARTVIHARVVEMVLFDEHGRVADARALGGHGPVVPAPGDWLWERVVAERRPTVCTARSRDRRVAEYLQSVGSRDVLAAPLEHAGELLGVLTARDRVDDQPTFSPDACDLFATMATQAAMALHAARLDERIRRDEAERARVAQLDPLTGMPNRSGFASALEALLRSRAGVFDVVAEDEERPAPVDPATTEQLRLELAPRPGTALSIDLTPETAVHAALLTLDLNRFKEVNTTLGHRVGDALVGAIAQHVREAVPSDAVVARLGGDELAVLMPSVSSRAEAVACAHEVLRAVRREVQVEGITIRSDAAVGLALVPEHGTDVVTLLRRADVALYAAKEHAEGCVEVFDPDVERAGARQVGLARDLRSALQVGQLSVHYQPKAEMESGTIVGVEALARWVHPVLGPIPPEEFIPVAEQAGLVESLTVLVLREALRQCRVWHDRGLGVHVAVNLSARSLRDPLLVESVRDALEEAGVAPQCLTLEITEGELVNDGPTAQRALERLHELGVQISIDDFGTGYSSLAYLSRLAADEVKIDKSFVSQLAHGDADAAIIRAVVGLAGRLGLRTVAEGVEDQQTWDLLRGLGVDVAQGYLLSHPLTGETLGMWLWERRRSTPAAVVRHLPTSGNDRTGGQQAAGA